MTKAEALKLAIDGERVRNICWPHEDYLIFDGNRFVLPESDIVYGTRYPESLTWELCEEKVSAFDQLMFEIDVTLNKIKKLYEVDNKYTTSQIIDKFVTKNRE
jgi:hypothetical protein